MTGKPSQETAIAALRHQAFDYLTKPCRLAEIAGLARPRRTNGAKPNANWPPATSPSPGRRAIRNWLAAARPWRRVKQLIARSRSDRQHRVDPRRNGMRKRAGRPRGPRRKPAGRPTIGGDQLRGAAGKPDRKRAVRPLPRCLHRRRFGPHRACSRSPTAARSSWTKSVSCRCRCKRNCCECWKPATSGGSATTKRSTSTCGSFVRRTAIWNRWSRREPFREDLMFRINTFEISVPSLRERPEDIPLLAKHLLRRHRSDGSRRTAVYRSGHATN